MIAIWSVKVKTEKHITFIGNRREEQAQKRQERDIDLQSLR